MDTIQYKRPLVMVIAGEKLTHFMLGNLMWCSVYFMLATTTMVEIVMGTTLGTRSWKSSLCSQHYYTHITTKHMSKRWLKKKKKKMLEHNLLYWHVHDNILYHWTIHVEIHRKLTCDCVSQS